eukprot:8116333-Pyramimonas_sp.AAC.1
MPMAAKAINRPSTFQHGRFTTCGGAVWNVGRPHHHPPPVSSYCWGPSGFFPDEVYRNCVSLTLIPYHQENTVGARRRTLHTESHISYTDDHRPSRKSLVSHRADGHPGRRYTGA